MFNLPYYIYQNMKDGYMHQLRRKRGEHRDSLDMRSYIQEIQSWVSVQPPDQQ